jgi:hypothetical protein
LKEHTHMKMEAVSTSTESHNGMMLPKMEDHVTRGIREKKAAKRNLRDTYTEKCWCHSATKFSHYNATGTSRS